MEEVLKQANTLWDSTLDLVKNKINDRNIFETFFASTYIYKISNDSVTIVTDGLTTSLAIKKYTEVIKECLTQVTQSIYNIEIISQSELDQIIESEKKIIPQSISPISGASPLLAKYTFDNFVVGDSNKEAFQSALLIASQPCSFNPLFIYSKSGLGKTHLLQAIANYVKNKNPLAKVSYITTADFVTEFIKSTRGTSDTDSLKEYFSNVDYLLVDDIQFLSEKQKTSEFFFHIFNTLVNSNKQIILTSDRHPSDLKGLEERLVSRFSSGLSVNIKSPELTTLINILKMKIPAVGLKLEDFDEDVLEFTAENFSSNIRELEGALNRIVFHSITRKTTGKFTLELAREAFFSSSKSLSKESTLSMQKIIFYVAEYYNLTEEQLKSKTRTSQIALSRQIAMYLCRNMLDIPFKKIGDEFGKRDHSTVMSAIEKVENLLKTDKAMNKSLNDIKAKIK